MSRSNNKISMFVNKSFSMLHSTNAGLSQENAECIKINIIKTIHYGVFVC